MLALSVPSGAAPLCLFCEGGGCKITQTAWPKREGNGLLETLEHQPGLQEPRSWGLVMALGMALEEKVGWCGQCAQSGRAAAQLGCARKGEESIVGKERLSLGMVYRLGPPGPSKYGHWSNASGKAGVMEA